MSENKIEPPPMAFNIGDGHAILFAEYKGETAGINEWHRKPDGTWCRGWVAFKGSAWAREFMGVPSFESWDVVQRDPLTLTPSILCRTCGSHGHITNGQWVKA